MGMAEIYLNVMADSRNSSRAAAVIGELRRNEGWCGRYLSLPPRLSSPNMGLDFSQVGAAFAAGVRLGRSSLPGAAARMG